jgi:hypothetical protein
MFGSLGEFWNMTTEVKIKILLFNNQKFLIVRGIDFVAPPEWYMEDTERLVNLIHCYEQVEVSQEELDAIKLMRHPHIIVTENGTIRDVLNSLVFCAKEHEKELERQKQLQKEKEEKAKQKAESRKKIKKQKLLESLTVEEKKILLEDLKKEVK